MDARELLEGSVHDDGLSAILVKKWEPFLEGVSGDYKKKCTAILLENESQHLQRILQESSTTSSAAGEYTKYIFPVVRKVFPNLISNEICSVQPMNAPVSAIFYFDYTYGTTKGTISQGQKFLDNFDRNYSLMAKSVDDEVVGAGNGTSKVFRTTLANRHSLQGSFVVTCTVGAASKTFADDGNGAFASTSGGVTISGTIDYNTGLIVVAFSTAPDNATNVTVDYQYESEATAGDVPEANFDVSMQEVRAKSRKMKALWSTEATDDLRAFHGMDAEAEVVGGIASQIALEIDRENIYGMRAAVPTGNTRTWNRQRADGIPDVDHIRSFLPVLATVSNTIYKSTYRGAGNWAVAAPEFVALLEALPEFVPAPEQPGNVVNPGITLAGTLSGRWKIYKDPMESVTGAPGSGATDVLVGYKGSSWLDAGYVYAPYVPLQVTPTFLDPNDFSMKKGMRTRYANKLVRSGFFGKVSVTNL